MTKDGYWRMLAAAAVAAAFAYGCGNQPTNRSWRFAGKRGGPDRLHPRNQFTAPDFESEVYTINFDGSGERRLTDSPGLDAFLAWSLAYVVVHADFREPFSKASPRVSKWPIAPIGPKIAAISRLYKFQRPIGVGPI